MVITTTRKETRHEDDIHLRGRAAALLIPVACDDPAPPTSLDLDSWPATPETAVADRIMDAVAQLGPRDELLSRRGEPYVAADADQTTHNFGQGYYGLTLPLDDDDHGALECSGAGADFANCLQHAMDEGESECRSHRVGGTYNAECKPAHM